MGNKGSVFKVLFTWISLISLIFSSNTVSADISATPVKEKIRLVDTLENYSGISAYPYLRSDILGDDQRKHFVSAQSYQGVAPFSNVKRRIAIIDTGVSISHQALANIDIVYYRNMLDNNDNIIDTHGHGTLITGLLASNGAGGAPKGVLPDAQYIIMKALDHNGESEDYVLARSIRTAVNQNARVILLSLGISVNSQVLREAVEYAYERNVLIVAAAGNNTTHAQYPAAYPHVLAVGSVSANGARSSFTPEGYEMDVLAQGENIVGLNIGTGTRISHGTSMAAPLVAALALALIDQNPFATVDEIKSHILFTSNLADSWGTKSSWGRINIQQALNTPLNKTTLLQNNTAPAKALAIPRNTIISSDIQNRNQSKWFRAEAGHDGEITLTIRNRKQQSVRIDFFDDSLRLLGTRWMSKDKQQTTFRIAGKDNLLRISADGDIYPIPFSVMLEYRIGQDMWESNSNIQLAKPLPLRAAIQGTFHTNDEQDWFYIDVPQSGQLDVQVLNVPEHMDPVLQIQLNNRLTTVDTKSAGGEERYFSNVAKGRYYINIKDYNGNVVNYPYTLDVMFVPSSIETPTDVQRHWALEDIRYLISQNIIRNIEGSRYYPERYISRAEYASYLVSSLKLAIPKAYVRSYEDVPVNHWAHQDIATAKYYGLINGYPDNTFRPDMPITRAELSYMTYGAYQAQIRAATNNSFTDVSRTHWANGAISSLSQAGILRGYSNRTFEPRSFTSKAEASSIIARLMKQQ